MSVNTSDLALGQVVTGFSFPVAAKYTYSSGSVVYSDGMDIARGVSINPEVDTGNDDNTFYANNRSAETAQKRFRSGTLNLTVDGLLIAAEQLLMGLSTGSTSTVTVGSGGTATTYSMIDYGDAQEIPYVGVGAVVRSMSNGVELFRGVVYPKVRFDQFAVAAETQGEDIDWQTTELSAQISRDDSANHNWHRVSELTTSELEAYNIVRAVLGMTVATALPTT